MDAFIGEIRPFAGNYAPRGWAFCDGQLMRISQNTALFSILGTTYGGDGMSNFALPNLMGRAAVHFGRGPGLTPRLLGERGGSTVATLIEPQMPSHTHTPNCHSHYEQTTPAEALWSNLPGRGAPSYGKTANVSMSPRTTGDTGGNQVHNNMQPYLGLSFIIALDGEYPARS